MWHERDSVSNVTGAFFLVQHGNDCIVPIIHVGKGVNEEVSMYPLIVADAEV